MSTNLETIAGRMLRGLALAGFAFALTRLRRQEWLWLAAVLGLPLVAILVAGVIHPAAAIPVLLYWLFVLFGRVAAMFVDIPQRREANRLYAEQLQAYQQQVHVADRQAGARETGQAVVEGLRQAYQETWRPPEDPTGTPQRPSTPPPSPPAPMGSTTPTLWVPTYQGPRQALQRRETSLEGLWMNDHRRIDPDDL